MSNDRQFQEMPGQALINMQEAALRTLEMERDLLRTSLRERDKRIAKLEAENAELKLDVELKASIARTAIANFEQAEREIERLSAPVTDEVMEELAAMEHERWSNQAIAALTDMTDTRRARWTRQAGLLYAGLTEAEKEQDRQQVRKTLDILAARKESK
jgi:hypothetical protein